MKRKKKLKMRVSLVMTAMIVCSSVSFASAGEDESSSVTNIQFEAKDTQTYNATTQSAFSMTIKRRICAGQTHSIAIANDGNVLAWGSNGQRQLGSSNEAQHFSELTGLDAVSLGTGYNDTVILKGDGTVWACGSSNGSSTFKQISGISDVVDVQYGISSALALKADGTVWTWGCNNHGEFGNSSVNSSFDFRPRQITTLSGVKAISLKNATCYALLSDGTVWSWGGNVRRLLGAKSIYIPVQVVGLENITAISGSDDLLVALKNDGTVWAIGNNRYGQLGDGTKIDSMVPVQVSGLSDVTQISAGALHSLALKSDGTVWGWGFNEKGALGDYTVENRTTPVRVKGIKNIVEISAGNWNSLFLEDNGTIWGCGHNALQKLLLPTTESFISVAYPIFGGDSDGGNGSVIADMPKISKIYTGEDHTLALCVDGTLWAWGNNTEGQLGVGDIGNQVKPVQITNIGTVETVVAGLNHTFIICEDGSIWTWGKNDHGQLGIENTENQFFPVKIQ